MGGGVGIELDGGTLVLAILKPADPGDGRSWIALKAEIANAGLGGGGGLSLSVDSVGIEVNKGAGTTPAPMALNWTTAIDLGRDGTYGGTENRVIVIVETTSGSVEHVIDYVDERFAVTAQVGIDIYGFVKGKAGIS